MALDMYNEELGLAIEYDDPQHSVYPTKTPDRDGFPSPADP
jgi:hypothetical protein